ncbi:hypothetical protein Tco_0419659, partial [Tanacetum coccineum]
MVSHASLAVLRLAFINRLRRVEDSVRKIHDLTMESAMIQSSVGGVDVDDCVLDPSMCLRTPKLLQWPLK